MATNDREPNGEIRDGGGDARRTRIGQVVMRQP